MAHPPETVNEARRLAAEGRSMADVARFIGVPRRTVAAWILGLSRPSPSRGCARCGHTHRLDELPAAYVYLLGLYLGDG
ncbi:MAG: helix-turn-helix transcriptional regulator [Thermoleophilaceae bacterium]|nr:helix-turn-helix transcriptional regulator [Thermoleophilaceae bacterium]